MKNSDIPVIDEWVNELKVKAGEIGKNTVFVGHSIGCQTILRFLEKENVKIKGMVLVAGWFNLVNLENNKSENIAKPWIKTPINFEAIKKSTKNITVILGSNDKWVPYQQTKEEFKKKLNAKVVTILNGGHITSDEGYGPVPFIFKEVKNFLN